MNAILVDFTEHKAGRSKKNKDLTREVQENHNTSADAGHYSQKLWPKKKKKETKGLDPDHPIFRPYTIVGAAKKLHLEMTLPYNRAYDMLPIAKQKEYGDRMAALQEKLLAACNAITYEVFRAAIETVREAHNGTFKAEMYPENREEFIEDFAIGISYSPMPESSHFGQMNEEEKQKLISKFQQERRQIAARATAHLKERLLKPVQSIIEKLSNPDARFHDVMMENIQNLVAMAPSLNLTGDLEVASAIEDLSKGIANINIDALRDSVHYRDHAKSMANEFLTKYGGLGQRKFVQVEEPSTVTPPVTLPETSSLPVITP